jgi:hypothetical protein
MMTALLLMWAVSAEASPRFIDAMRSTERREKAACAALARIRETEPDEAEKCVVNHVIETRGPGGLPAFIVFFHHEWSKDEDRPGKPIGHFEVFGSAGQHLEWFGNANVLEENDRVVPIEGRSAVIVQHIRQDVDCRESLEDQVTGQALHVISLEEPTRPILSVVLGPPARDEIVKHRPPQVFKQECFGDVCGSGTIDMNEVAPAFTWGSRTTCTRKQCQISIGPKEDLAKGKHAALFTWKPGTKDVVGPQGSVQEKFLRFQGSLCCGPAQQFAIDLGMVDASCLKKMEPCREQSP